jgi:hypothetical protein
MSHDWIIDLEEIRRLARQDEAENLRFRQYLRFELSFTKDDLDVLVWEALAEVAPAIDCLACGNCCRSTHTAFTPEEIEVLAPRLGLTPAEFRHRHIVVEAGVAFINPLPCPFFEGNRCKVYEDRPEVCREYPHLYKPDSSYRSKDILGNVDVCPIVFNVWHLLKDRTGFEASKPPKPAS